MSLYQRKLLADMSDIGSPAALPDAISALSDAALADLSATFPEAAPELGFAGEGFFPVADPPPAPVMIISPYDFLNLLKQSERVAILTAATTDMAMADWMNMLNHVSLVHLDDPKTIAGVDALEAATLIAAGRAAQILGNEAPS